MSNKANKILRVLKSILTGKVTVNDKKFDVNLFTINKLFLESAKDYEKDVCQLIKKLLHLKEGYFIDIGANTGITMLNVTSISETQKYIGFEPQVEACGHIFDLIKKNNLNFHQAFPFAISDETGFKELKYELVSDARASLADNYRPHDFFSFSRSVPTYKGDHILAKLDLRKISIIKIDVEGAENDVLRGLEQTLLTKKPFLIFEQLPNIIVSTGEKLSTEILGARKKRVNDINNLLKNYSYNTFYIKEDSLVEQSVIPDDKDVKNYLAAHVEDTSSLQT